MDAETLVATRNLAVFEILDQKGVEYRVGLYTYEICEALPTVRLVIMDAEDVVPLKYDVSVITGMLAQQEISSCTSEQFLQDPDFWLRVVETSGKRGAHIPPKRTIAFVAYSGGTGRTTLALDTALRFAWATESNVEKPALLAEFTYGVSALRSLTGMDMPSLYDLVTREVEDIKPAVFRNVTLIPMDYDTARDLSAEMVREYLKRQMSQHILTVVDTQWPHGLIQAVRDQVDRWLIVTTPRVDAVANAEKLAKELGEKVAIVLNQKGGLADSIALSNLEKDLELPRISRPDAFDGKKLGEEVLRWLYGKQAWTQRYCQPRRWWQKLFAGGRERR